MQHNPAHPLLCSDRASKKAMAMAVPGKGHHPAEVQRRAAAWIRLQNPPEPQLTVCTALGQSHDHDHENDDDQGTDNESHN
jgi:hypothetical protein